MSRAIRCRGCVYLTVNPWARTRASRAARATSAGCPLHGDIIRWQRSTGDYAESHNRQWWITPIYGGCTRPEQYELRFRGEPTDKQIDGWRVVGSGSTQRECKAIAQLLLKELVA